jgi:uncharacterized protein YegL
MLPDSTSGIATGRPADEEESMRDATDIVVVLDKSGSMGSTKDDVIGGFNRFLEEQKAFPGECSISMVLFDSLCEVKASMPIRDVAPLTDKTYVPGGMTALLDALGRAISDTGKRLAALDESRRPDKVLVVVITDGQENSSKEHTLQVVRGMIEHQQGKYNWKFMFLGANIDSFAEAGNLGFSKCATVNFTQSRKGYECLYRGLSLGAKNYRLSGELGQDWRAIVDEGNQPDGDSGK